MFLSTSFLLSICIATNAFAESSANRGERLSYTQDGHWERLTVEELSRFLGIVLYMSVVKYMTLERYWSTNPLYANNPVRKAMTRLRFQAILAFLQVTPPADIDHKADKLTRIRTMIDHVRDISKMFYQPRRDVAVDERMVASKHRFSGIRQFMKNKPCRFGIKLWVLACNTTGYTYNFFVYLGKSHTNFIDKTKGLAYNVALKLCEPLYNQGYRVFTDCFYTSLNLGKELKTKCMFLIGVIKSNSLSMPVEFKNWKDWEKCASRGDFRWHRNNEDNFVFVQWKDCKTVTFMSPLHAGSSATTCIRTMKSRANWNKKRLSQPQVASDYNKCMGGVDLSNQYVNKYPTYIRTQNHWWKVLFFHLLDIMVVNSFILYTEFLHSDQAIDLLVTCPGQLEYRESIAMFLMNIGNVTLPAVVKLTCMPEFLSQRSDCVYCNAEASLKKTKLPSYKTFVYCKNCCVSLCLTRERNCFKMWHSPEGEAVRKCAAVCCRKRKLCD